MLMIVKLMTVIVKIKKQVGNIDLVLNQYSIADTVENGTMTNI